jgi:hypothetical protein
MLDEVSRRRLVLCVEESASLELTTHSCTLEDMGSTTVNVLNLGDRLIESIDRGLPVLAHHPL